MKKVNLAIVGYGGMGSYHGDVIETLENYSITGIYDTDETRYAEAERRGIKTGTPFVPKRRSPRIKVRTPC